MKFSIICLTYKRPTLLEECVYSVLQQTYTDWELLVINDCEEQTIRFDHPKVRIFNLNKKFESISDKRNFGKNNADGDWITNLDDDDFMLPTYLQTMRSVISDDTDWISCQRPILYYEDSQKIRLAAVPLTNAFFYKKRIAESVYYESGGKEELNAFFEKTSNQPMYKKRLLLLKPEECGHVWRQEANLKRKYSLTEIFAKIPSVGEQNVVLKEIECEQGDIYLEPKWSKDYTTIIKTNLKITPPILAYKKIKGGEELLKMVDEVLKEHKDKIPKSSVDMLKTLAGSATLPTPVRDEWQKVKPSWINAKKFIAAIKSRGIISTALDATGIDNTCGDRVSDEILRQRKLSCFGDKPKKVLPCSRLRHLKEKGYFCGGCGCGNNDMARLDADTSTEYTKLHYPQLECPLKRRGFSNAVLSEYIKVPTHPPLSIIIPVLNDNAELNLTIESIRDTSPPDVEIIVIDDKSDEPVKINDESVKLIRLEKRLGVGGTRHLGALSAGSNYLLFIDSHMRFDSAWYNNIMERLISNPQNIVWCGTCLGLDEKNMDINNPRGAYHGARLSLYEEKEKQVFEGKWIPEKEGDEYEISCLMGACYFFHKSWFFHIKGTESLKMWGSDEPLLSAKTLLAGGSIRLVKDVRIGHKFRQSASYTTDNSYLIYNKLRSMYMLFPDELYLKLRDKIPDDANKKQALRMLENDREIIDDEKKYYRSIFIIDIYEACKNYNIVLP